MTSVDLPPSIAALMALLPPPDTVWPVESRNRWIDAFNALLDLNYSTEFRVPMSQGGEAGSKPACVGFDSLGARQCSEMETGVAGETSAGELTAEKAMEVCARRAVHETGWRCECGEWMPPEYENCFECLKVRPSAREK